MPQFAKTLYTARGRKDATIRKEIKRVFNELVVDQVTDVALYQPSLAGVSTKKQTQPVALGNDEAHRAKSTLTDYSHVSQRSGACSFVRALKEFHNESVNSQAIEIPKNCPHCLSKSIESRHVTLPSIEKKQLNLIPRKISLDGILETS